MISFVSLTHRSSILHHVGFFLFFPLSKIPDMMIYCVVVNRRCSLLSRVFFPPQFCDVANFLFSTEERFREFLCCKIPFFKKNFVTLRDVLKGFVIVPSNFWPHLDNPELVLVVNVKSLLGCTQLILNLKSEQKNFKTFVGDGVGTSVFFLASSNFSKILGLARCKLGF
jgi:hypothetical protein